PPAPAAAKWPAMSHPFAQPEWTTTPAAAAAFPTDSAYVTPNRVGLRVPMVATPASSAAGSPAIQILSGASSISARSHIQVGQRRSVGSMVSTLWRCLPTFDFLSLGSVFPILCGADASYGCCRLLSLRSTRSPPAPQRTGPPFGGPVVLCGCQAALP